MHEKGGIGYISLERKSSIINQFLYIKIIKIKLETILKVKKKN